MIAETFEALGPGVRLSPTQRWLFSTGDAARNSSSALVRIEGRVDIRRLQVALERVVQRHEALRTSFARDARLRLPLQVVAPGREASWHTLDVAARSTEQQDALVEELWQRAGEREWALALGPLVEVTLVRCGEASYALLLSCAAAVADEWSLERVLRQVAALYAGLPLTEEEPVAYGQFAAFHNELVEQGEVRAPRLAAPALLPFEAPSRGNAVHAEQHVMLEAGLLRQLAQAAQRDGVTLETWLVCAWQSQLALLSDSRDIELLVRWSARDSEEVQGIIGPVASWNVLSLDQRPVRSFAELSRAATLALETARLSGACVEALSETESIRAAQESIGFRYFDSPGNLAPGDAAWHLSRISGGKSGLRLELAVSVTSHGLRVSLVHDRARLSEAGATTVLRQYVALLQRLAAEPAHAMKALRLEAALSARSRAHAEWSPPLAPLHRDFERHAALHPDALALRCGEHTLTHRELDTRANRLAQVLLARGLGPERTVALCCGRTPNAIVGMLGTLKAGAAYVPLDPHAPAERLRYQLEQVDFLLTEDAVGSMLPESSRPSLSLDDVELLAQAATHAPSVDVPLDALASVVFTSGSTGVPKGVAITHRGIASYTRSIVSRLRIETGWHFASVSTLSADLGNTSIFAALATGGCLHLITYETATDGSEFWNYTRRFPLDVLKIVPSHLSALLDAASDPPGLPRRRLILGGETFSLELLAKLESLRAECAVVNHYGPTETTVGALALPVSELLDRAGAASVPVGRSLMNGEAHLLDEALRPVAIGVTGELFLGGSGLARGYLGRPGITAQSFVPHPFASGERLYRTGDRARYRPDGTIEFLGRTDHQLKIRGFRVELGEIEARLRECPGVRQAVVVVRDVGGSAALVGYVAAAGVLDLASLRDSLRQKLPDYMIPGDIVVLAALPLTANGKLDRAALPSPSDARASRQHVAPRTRAETIIAEIWAELLKLPSVSVEDDFFALGGHSLLAIPLMHRIQTALGRSVSLTAIFDAPTVAGLARRLEADSEPPAVTTLRAGEGPPLFCFDPTGQHLAFYQGLSDSMPGTRAVLGVQLDAALLSENLSMEAIVAALATAVRRACPEGPYRLLGWSFGGALALGVARALELEGGSVELLGIVDTTPRAELYETGELDIVDELAAYVDATSRETLRRIPGADLKSLRARLALLEPPARVDVAITWAKEQGLLDREAPVEGLKARYALLRAGALFVRDLPSAALRAPIHVWWSTETIERHGPRPWDFARYTTGSSTFETLQGDHFAAIQGDEARLKIGAAIARLNGPCLPRP